MRGHVQHSSSKQTTQLIVGYLAAENHDGMVEMVVFHGVCGPVQ